MEDILKLVKSVRYPCITYDEAGKFIYQNEMFSLFFSQPCDETGQSLFELSKEIKHAKEVSMITLSNQKLPILIERIEINGPRTFVILLLTKKDQEWAQLSMEKMESSRFVALGQMASGIAHEINNPLTVVLSKLHLVEQMISSLSPDHTIKTKSLDSIHKAQSNVYRISRIIKGLRSLARDSREDNFEKKDLNDVVKESIDMCEERMKNGGIIFHQQLSDTPLFAAMRPYQIAQVIINLINNAIDALSGVSLGEIHLSTFRQDTYACLRVSDTGPGVKPEHESMIMTPFFTTKESGVGTGLGLSISKKILFTHGGKINLNLEVSRSCFEIFIPISGGSRE